TDAGGIVEVAGSAPDAVAAVRRFKPDVLVSDIGMPGEDGYALIQRVREMGETIPAIALTAYTRGEDKMRAIAAGYTTHLAKPVDPSEFLATLVNLGQTPR